MKSSHDADRAPGLSAQPRPAPYGSWKSPITSALAAGEAIALGRLVLDGADTYWAEMRPSEQGRNIVVRRGPDGETHDVTPPGFSVGTAVHEYGARAFTVADGVAYFANVGDQRLYAQRPGQAPIPLTPVGELRYAGMQLDRPRDRLICVRENHETDKPEPVNRIVAVDLAGEEEAAVLVSGNDFYALPKPSPDGAALAWLTWNHPNMPWDGTELWVGFFDEMGRIGECLQIAGGIAESVMQPEWADDGSLYFVSDRSGWANLYRWQEGTVECILPMRAEFSKTHWWVGISGFGFVSPTTLACSYVENGIGRLALLDLEGRRLEPIATPYSEMASGDLATGPGRVVFVAASPLHPMSVLELNVADRALTVLQTASTADVDPAFLSEPEAIEFPTEKDVTAHAFYYPPRNPDFVPPEGELPPLVVICHGGPHSSASLELHLAYQYWTSRGVAIVDVNYGGSTGYGRAYRERLIGEWGVVDVDDCVNAARYLIERGDVDPERVAVSGGSAGGYTTLSALTFRDVFSAGTSHFGVSDLESLLEGIHKFDTHSLRGLVGPYPLYRQRYIERSPINFIEQIDRPVLLFHGLDDTIIPADQSEVMFQRLKERGVPVAYLPYPGEGHGFVRAENIGRALEVELYFYSRVFGFELADPVEPIAIENL